MGAGGCLQAAWKEGVPTMCAFVFACRPHWWSHPEVCARVLHVPRGGHTSRPVWETVVRCSVHSQSGSVLAWVSVISGLCRVLVGQACAARCWPIGARAATPRPPPNPQVLPDSAASGHYRFHLSPAANPHGSSWSPGLCMAPVTAPFSCLSICLSAHHLSASRPLPLCCPLRLPNRFLPQDLCTCYAPWPSCSSLPSSPSLGPQDNSLV